MAKKQSFVVKLLKGLLVIILFIGFFEAGLFSAYTIVTSETPDVEGLINSQLDVIFGFINSDEVNDFLIKDPTVLNITNRVDVADELKKQANVDGVNVDQINASTYQNLGDNNLEVTIEALGYSSVNVSSNQIILSQDPDYQIVATANAKAEGKSVVIDTSSIKITSILKLYTNTGDNKITIGD